MSISKGSAGRARAVPWQSVQLLKVSCKKRVLPDLLQGKPLAGVRLQEVEDKVLAVGGVVRVEADIPSINFLDEIINIVMEGIGRPAHQ